jgi:hypothetical protein
MLQMVQALQVLPGICLFERPIPIAVFHLFDAGDAISAADCKDFSLDLPELVFQETTQSLL